MKINELEILTTDLSGQQYFYGEVLQLPVSMGGSGNTIEVQAGLTRLVFRQAPPKWAGVYHFAFNIPENQYEEARDWLTRRVALIADNEGRTEFHFENWNADAFYFYDQAGNILEFIARHTLDNASDMPFSSHSILSVSEIGVGTHDVPSMVEALQGQHGITPYGGEPGEEFAAVGDEEGLFIVVRLGRIWMPETGIEAGAYPVSVNITTPSGAERNLVL
jgi:catechol 2,3-dioxygenase-like lactoylglutathione lyase family enzyme